MLQIFEMWAAGYSFFLLNNIFTSHWGFQKSSSRPSWRKKLANSIFWIQTITNFTLQIPARY